MANDATISDDFFLARQPILGRDQCLVAYELLFRTAGACEANVTDQASATAAVISHASQLGMEVVLGGRLAFLNVDEVVLMSDFVRFLPHDGVILEILETVRATPELIARVEELRELGFKFALDDVIADSDDVSKLFDLAEVIKIDLKGVDRARLPALVRKFSGRKKKLLAEKVETVEEFEACLALGFDYFQGFYFARPTIMSGKKIAPTELVILRLLDLINSDADDGEIEMAVKRDASVGLNLLRLVNTPAAGSAGHIDSLGEAINKLGRDRLQRWLQILLYSKPGGQVELNSPLLQMATTRGKLMELMAQQLHPGMRAHADTGFTVGIMSLMDALFSMSMQDVLETVEVPDDVRAALLAREGELGEMLRVVELLENPSEGQALTKALKKLGISVRQVREIELRAFEWVNELAHDTEMPKTRAA
ncbi:EAL and HDOD domain-containing protein [Massilia sp. GCM10020059]|uniref:EAL domain-containing protein n=1 Tax=Massilia agrisoli TaxID=2892444 RepID=A0ABS8IU00_9BURK|nr:EAL domain-containing protein [Massilia agrisoli]MCC6071910.1 EAL domain-containing protein [Massilia agrisoli]